MADEESLWEKLGSDILEHPEHDRPRLEFAARLDEQDNDKFMQAPPSLRAELIFLQVKLARMSPDHPEWFRIATRVRSLLIDHEKDWTPSVLRSDQVLQVVFHRGFVAKLTIQASYLIEMARDLFDCAPIEHLDIVGMNGEDGLKPVVSTLKRTDTIARVRSLGLDSQRIENVESLSIAAWPQIRWLSLRYNRLTESSIRRLLNDAPKTLRSVDLYGNEGDPAPRFLFDQGTVIGSEQTSKDEELIYDFRVRRETAGGFELHPDRFAMAPEERRDFGGLVNR
jgi:uncharacterized protein (TIGR02996 family)